MPVNGSMKVLTIEDDPDTQANLREILELDGYQIEGASLVRDALDRDNWNEYTAIILDRHLPDGTAEEIMPRLAELAPNAAIIVVTGHADFESTVAALHNGVSDYILKPIDADCLRASLSSRA